MGFLNSSSLDPETLDRARFARVTGRYTFANDRTDIILSAFAARGVQDTDSASTPDKLTVVGAGLELEHRLKWTIGTAQTALFGRVETMHIRERACCIEDLRDTSLTVGFRIRFGGAAPPRGTQPKPVNWGRVLGHIVAVD